MAAARRSWNLGTRCIAELKNFFCDARQCWWRLNGAVLRGMLALEETAQQAEAIEAAHGRLGSWTVNSMPIPLTRGDAADDTSRAHFNVSGGENQFNEATFRGRIRGADKNSPEGDVFEAGDRSLDSYLPTDKGAFGCFDTGVTPRSFCVRRFGIRHSPSSINGVTQSAALARARDCVSPSLKRA